jgi:hypothetical protein
MISYKIDPLIRRKIRKFSEAIVHFWMAAIVPCASEISVKEKADAARKKLIPEKTGEMEIFRNW